MASKERIAKVQELTKAQWKSLYEALGAPPDDPRKIHEWMAKASALLCHEALLDFSSVDTGRERRRHAMQLIRWAIDTMPNAEMAAELRELYEAVKDGKDASHQPSGDEAISPSKADLC